MATRQAVVNVSAPSQVLEVISPGPQGISGPVGPVGAQGAQGDAGRDGSAGRAAYQFNQLTPATTWVVHHNLGFVPTVVVLDSAGTEVWGEVQYTDLNNLTIYFAAGFSGVAYLG